jgi:hypothetical protein
MGRPPYNPFEYDRRPQRRLECSWGEIDEENPRVALKTLARFRRENRDVADISVERLTWGYIWTEGGRPLDMSLSSEERARLREQAVQTVVLFCQHGEHIAYSQSFIWPPDFVCDAILAEEDGRPSMGEVQDG